MKCMIMSIIAAIILLVSACGNDAIQPNDNSTLDIPPSPSVEHEESLDEDGLISPDTDKENKPSFVSPQVYDRFIVTGDGEAFVYVPGIDEDIVSVFIEDRFPSFCIQPYYDTNIAMDGYQDVEHNTSVQYIGGTILHFNNERYIAFENIYGGWNNSKTLPKGGSIGMMYLDPKRIDGMRWYCFRYCLAPDGILYAYGERNWIWPFPFTGDLIPIAENVTKAAVGLYSYNQYYVLYLTNDGTIHYYAETDNEIIHESIAEQIQDFDISGFGAPKELRFYERDGISFGIEPFASQMIFLQEKDGSMFYGRFFGQDKSASEILTSIQETLSSGHEKYFRIIKWFVVTENACVVLNSNDTLSFSDIYSDKYPLDFQTIDIEKNGLVTASVFFQGATDVNPPTSCYMLALFEDGEIVCEKIEHWES